MSGPSPGSQRRAKASRALRGIFLEDYITNNFTGQKVCVVGNAFVTVKYGETIDSHDIVVRLNDYVLSDEFSPFVGVKSTHCCNNAYKATRTYEDEVFICPFNSIKARNNFFFVNICASKDWRKEASRHIAHQYSYPHSRLTSRMTTGSTMLYILDRLNIRANAFGFDFLKTGKMSDADYLYDAHPVHMNKIDKEEALIRSLPNIKLYE